jgi:catechol 2,3-dioxygenase-like lactoylglutathione lyase family enzyme
MGQPIPDLAIPILPSRSISVTVAFYQRLGFEGGAHALDPAYAILRRGTLELHFFAHPALVPAESSAGCYLRVQDVDGIHRDFAASPLPSHGIPRMDAPQNKPWGLREFALVDADGNLLRVGQVLTP